MMAPAEVPSKRDSLFERLAIFDMPTWTHGDDDGELHSHGDLIKRRRFRAAGKTRDVDKHDRRQTDVNSLDDRAVLDLAKGVGAAAGAVAGGVGNGAKAIASGQGVGAAAGAVAGGIGKGVGAVADAGKAAGEDLIDFLGGGSSDNDSEDEKKKKKEKPPPKAEEPPSPSPPPPSPTLPPPTPPPPEPPQTSEALPQVSITPKPPPPPPQDPQPSSQPPKQTGKPVDNIPPPKVEISRSATSTSESTSEKPPTTSNESESTETSPTSTVDNNEDISLSTVVPGATTISVSGSIVSLTPVITGPIPAITSEVRKGIDREPPDTTPFAMRPSSTSINSISSSDAPLAEAPESTNNGGDKGTGNKDVGEGSNGGGLSPAAEKALISVFTILGVLALIAIAFFFWRRRKAGKTTFVTFGGGAMTIPASSFLDRPKDLARRLAAKLPILRNRFGDRGWVGLDEPYSNDFTEKKSSIPSQQEPSTESPIVVQNSSTESSATVPSKAHVPEQPRGGGLMPKPSISSTAPQINLTLPSTFGQQRLSDLSSLSSGFGDGDIIIPPPTATVKPYQTSRISTGTEADQSQKRDTVYTEASEDTPPRFRTVNSWVRQQTGRVKRAKQREEQTANETGVAPPVPSLPPEQEFRLMMPDGEEPRRVEDVHLNIGTAH